MHLAYVSADRGVPIGGAKGASVHVRGVVGALDRQGHTVSVLAANVAEPLAGRRVTTLDFGYDRTLKDLKQAIRSAGGGETLAREAHALLLGGRLTEALAEVDARHPIDAIYERYSLFSYAGLSYSRQRHLPFGLEVNAPLVEEQSAYRGLYLTSVATAVERHVIRQADVVFVPSRELGEWTEEGCGREGATVVVPNGVDTDLFARARFRSLAQSPESRGRFVVAFVGSLKPWHGIENLVQGFRALREQVPRAHLLVVGDGPMRPLVEETADCVGREHVTLAGSVAHEEVPSWLARADVAVAPYPELDDFYFSPLKVVEYQAAGLAVVASRIGHIERQIDDGRTGLLVAPDDVGDLVRALTRLFEDESLRRRLGERARREAIRDSSWDTVARRVTDGLDRVARERGSSLAEEAQ